MLFNLCGLYFINFEEEKTAYIKICEDMEISVDHELLLPAHNQKFGTTFIPKLKKINIEKENLDKIEQYR